MLKRSAPSVHVLTRSLLFALPLVLTGALACDGGGEQKSITDQIGPPTKKLSELDTKSKVSDEEIQRRRKEAGFKTKAESDAELAATNAKEMETVERAWIKTRVKDYKALTTDTKKFVDDLEKEAGKWAAAKDPQKALDKVGKGLTDRFKELIKRIDKLSERSTKGGNTQATFNKLFRPLEEIVNGLSPTISTDAAYTDALKNVRTELDNAVKALDEIEKDETIEANKFHEGEGEDAAKTEAKGKKKAG